MAAMTMAGFRILCWPHDAAAGPGGATLYHPGRSSGWLRRASWRSMGAMTQDDPHAITSLAALEALYDQPRPVVLGKVRRDLDAPCRDFIAHSPFCTLSTFGADGRVRCTPRGDAPGFIAVLSERELALPDRRGNNRIDALRDILANPAVALLFLIPGVGETLRVHGKARLTTDPALRARFAVAGKEPATVIRIAVEEAFMQCSRAVIRSGLWGQRERPNGVPTAGTLLASATQGAVDAATYDAEQPGRVATTLY
jgi:PPOX class probable FMN-dependent enzyme